MLAADRQNCLCPRSAARCPKLVESSRHVPLWAVCLIEPSIRRPGTARLLDSIVRSYTPITPSKIEAKVGRGLPLGSNCDGFQSGPANVTLFAQTELPL